MRIDFDFDIAVKDKKVINRQKIILERAMRKMEEHAVRLVPVDTGTLRNSIHLVKIDDFRWELRDGVEYGVFVEFGSTPHIIVPRVRKALKFKKGGKVVFAAKVRHPGSPAQPFFRPALDMVKEVDINTIISQVS